MGVCVHELCSVQCRCTMNAATTTTREGCVGSLCVDCLHDSVSLLPAGADTNIRNNENQVPYDLSSKNPEVGRLLMIRGIG